jgi:hypothetical protein
MACPPPSSRQRIPDRSTKSGDRFKLRGLLPRLYSRLLIALIVTWIVRLGAAAARCGEQRFMAMRESPLVGTRSVR